MSTYSAVRRAQLAQRSPDRALTVGEGLLLTIALSVMLWVGAAVAIASIG